SIIFGGSLLGIGDFFLSYLVINFIQKEVSTKIAIIASVIIASGTLAIYFLYPYINGNIPYSILIVPLTLIIYLVGLKKFNS
ncbi:MAG: hypothetical protein NTV81_00315, partial [Candidatus Komeilibacteria bacterium]|nr:hypothetical protein [Candidatus Komeilibacteria bacterium]